MTTYVLVHGAWGGAHTWRSVRPLLASGGHAVFTPALTGIGERAHLASAEIDLSTHVHDVAQQVLYEDLDDLVLLGFSYGGMVVAGVTAFVADRIRELVFLDAFVPRPGESVADLSDLAVPPAAGPGVDWLIPPRDRAFEDPEEAAFAAPRRTPQPAKTFTEPVSMPRPLEALGVGLTYVKATGDLRRADGPDPFWDAADLARASDRWRYAEIDTDHMVPQNRPHELAEILLALA